MALKHFQNKALVLSCPHRVVAHCRRHRLNKGTFDRWLDTIGYEEALRHKDKRRSKTPRSGSENEVRAKAVQAFWAMHVGTLNWSGANAAVYAKVHRLDPTSLRLWRRRFDAEQLASDWRERLHPSAFPRTSSLSKIGTGVSSAAKELPVESLSTEVPSTVRAADRRAIRRRFSDAEKLAIVQKAEAPGTTGAAICRRHGIVTSMLFRWRVQFGFWQSERAKLVAVRVGDQHTSSKRTASTVPLLVHDFLPVPDGMVAVALID